ncbi:MAG: ABC transporter ATP-binding protein [Planctomycetota bacterium]|jgi:peptide/nickel transport system ATP-binding protein
MTDVEHSMPDAPNGSPEDGAKRSAPVVAESERLPLLEVHDLVKHFPIRKGFLRRVTGHVKAVDGVSFAVRPGETLGLVGESGCGKTTTARCIVRAMEPTSGTILFRPVGGPEVDMATLGKAELKGLRRHVQMIFQDPYSSLNPRMPVIDIVAEPLKAHRWRRADYEARVTEILDLVGLDPRYMRRYPHAFSGGQRQRIGIARALALKPSLVIADEPVSALDVSVQAQILNLLEEMQERMDLTYVLIAHDLSVVRYVCDRVAVMYLGRIVELSRTEELFVKPMHPYTSALLSAVPDLDPDREWLGEAVSGEASLASASSCGCAFAPRCTHATDICRERTPTLVEKASGEEGRHFAACHLSGELSLAGV